MSTAALQLGERARVLLRRGPQTARSLAAELGCSQPTLSRALRTLQPDLLTLGAARSIQYLLRDAARQPQQATVYRAADDGQLHTLGTLLTCPTASCG